MIATGKSLPPDFFGQITVPDVTRHLQRERCPVYADFSTPEPILEELRGTRCTIRATKEEINAGYDIKKESMDG